MKYLYLISIFIFFNSCKTEETKPKISTNQAMYEDVLKIYKSIDPTKIDYLFNEKRAYKMEAQLKQLKYPVKLNLQLLYAKELMRCNKIKKAIATTADIDIALKDYNIKLPQAIQEKYLILKAIINMRKGELDNCINSHHSTSCILPFSNAAQHKNRNGSESAITFLQSVLDINPQNYQAIWLLNICMETLGKTSSDIQSKYDLGILNLSAINHWQNKSMDYGINHNGLAGGVISDDFNNDGNIDIICSSWGEGDGLKYYENDGNGKFKDLSTSSNLKNVHGGLNINQCDYNNDGFLDIFVMRGAWFESQGKIPNSLIKNNGDGSFSDVTKEAGIYTLAPTQASIWVDFNQDGNIDLFVANESSTRAQYSNELWINNGDGTFTDNISGSGIEKQGFYKACSQVELSFDKAKPAIFLSNYKSGNKLFSYKFSDINQSITFTDISKSKGISDPETSFSSFAFDYNNSGSENIFVSGYGDSKGLLNPTMVAGANYQGKFVGAQPKLYKDLEGTSNSEEIVFEKGIYTMGCNFGDLDNDGYDDIYLATGDPAMGSIVPNMIYKNIEGKAFKDISFETGMAHLQKGHGVSFADFDHDGDQDIYHVLGGAYEGDSFQNAYFENPGNTNNWITLKLIGTKSNKAAIGAKVKITVTNSENETRSIYRKVSSGSSFGANSLQLEIGLGDSDKIQNCIIIWPSPNSVSEFKNIEINKEYIITEYQGITEK